MNKQSREGESHKEEEEEVTYEKREQEKNGENGKEVSEGGRQSRREGKINPFCRRGGKI